ncbi:hypothetical protein O9929_24860 [Vibrio lentus]|nr:hypothetical protein [Vibrio lentus]
MVVKKFTQTVRITEEVTNEIESLSDLAPLHNPAGAIGIRAAIGCSLLPQFAVFDTAFHQTMPQRAFTGAIAKRAIHRLWRSSLRFPRYQPLLR